MCRNCPLENESARLAYNIQEAETVEDRQAYHQSSVVEVAGKIVEQSISILIDLGSTHSYITPRVVEICALRK